MEVSHPHEDFPKLEVARFDRRQFCASLAASGALGVVGGLPSQSLAANSIATAGELKPVFENIVCRWTPENPRHDHQQLFPLKDGRIMLIWAEYYADRPSAIARKPATMVGQALDEVPCRVSARISDDRCRTWSDRIIMQENTFKNNAKLSNLLRLASGEVLFFFSGWDSNAQRNIYVKRSGDDCETWGETVQVSRPGWYCNNHGRIMVLKSGRIILPTHTAVLEGEIGAPYAPEHKLHSFVYYSDDGFKTWKESEDSMTAPGRGAHEPAMVELKDGQVLCLLRTTTGRLYKAYSEDEGVHWSTPVPTHFPAPDSEPFITRIPSTGDLMAMWNNVESTSNWPRTPLSVAISRDEGETWGNYHDIDPRPNRDAAYPYVFFQDDEAVVTYYTRSTSWGRDTEVMMRIYKVDQFYS